MKINKLVLAWVSCLFLTASNVSADASPPFRDLVLDCVNFDTQGSGFTQPTVTDPTNGTLSLAKACWRATARKLYKAISEGQGAEIKTSQSQREVSPTEKAFLTAAVVKVQTKSVSAQDPNGSTYTCTQTVLGQFDKQDKLTSLSTLYDCKLKVMAVIAP